MNSKCLLFVWLALFVVASARPKNKILNLGTESEPETKIREKRKYEIPLLRQLEESGVGVKRESPPAGNAETTKESSPSPDAEEEKPEIPPEEVQPGLRIKKQSPNNVCIKVGGCGKTVCGPIVSARGPVVSDMRSMMQGGGKPMLSVGELNAAGMNAMSDAMSKLDRLNPVQGRTIDTFVTPVTLGTMGYGSPASFSAPSTADLSHSFFKPPPVPTVPAVAVIAAPHQPSHPLIHPLLMPHLLPHLMPHIMPSLMSSFGSYYPHRFEPTRYEPVQTEIKQPIPLFPPPLPSYQVSSDNTLVCQPMRSQRLDGTYDYIYKPDLAIDKSLNVSDSSKKSLEDDSERRIQEHLRKVNEIKEEISQLNRAAQRIVDQQERMQQMQQKQLGWGSSGSSGSSGHSSNNQQMTNPYMGSGYYNHPSVPWGYSRSNILSFPNSHDDIDFFLNLLRAGKRIGYISDAFQQNAAAGSGEVKGDVTKTPKEVTDMGAQGDDSKSKKPEKKSS